MKCKYCKSENIIGVEIQGAYDWVLFWECQNCLRKEHRSSWLEILDWSQPKEYWPAHFELEWGKKAINQHIPLYYEKKTQNRYKQTSNRNNKEI